LFAINKKIFVGVFLLTAIVVFIMLGQRIRQHSVLQFVQEDEIIPYLNDGDIICRLGDRIWSNFFKELSPTDKRFSHLGIVRIRDNTVSVINAEGLAVEGKDFVNEVSLKYFLKIAKNIGIYRLRTIEGKKISDMALEYKGRPFDWQFDMNEEDTLYCSELLYVILKKLSPEIELNLVWLKEIGKYIIPLEVCSQSEYFIEIGYWTCSTTYFTEPWRVRAVEQVSQKGKIKQEKRHITDRLRPVAACAAFKSRQAARAPERYVALQKKIRMRYQNILEI
jgi:hypothetical protein